MKLSRRQQIALKYLDECRWQVPWSSIQAALWMSGERGGQGDATVMALKTRGLVEMWNHHFTITDKGREVAKTINVTLRIDQS